jgi:ABC-type multidrug transport system ATPase subunit
MQTGSVRGMARKKTLNLPFRPVTLAFKDLRYYVPNPAGAGELQLLHNISGVFQPGVLTALMGASGTGKTTLMDVLAGIIVSRFLHVERVHTCSAGGCDEL